MKAKVLMAFHAYNIVASTGDEIEIADPKVYLDLYQAGFVSEQIQRASSDVKTKKKKEQ